MKARSRRLPFRFARFCFSKCPANQHPQSTMLPLRESSTALPLLTLCFPFLTLSLPQRLWL